MIYVGLNSVPSYVADVFAVILWLFSGYLIVKIVRDVLNHRKMVKEIKRMENMYLAIMKLEDAGRKLREL